MTEHLRLTGLLISKIEERFELQAIKGPDGKYETRNQSLGWYITIEPLKIAICVGHNQPELPRFSLAAISIFTLDTVEPPK